ncbi:MAG: preprotein translocase subunit SecG [Candidatus Binatia bacterium]|nr:preprotein translocase subunit SecG [Candidatus Binatia bacterium]
MDIAITVVHVIACFFLIIVVLLQTGKGADMGAVFGGSSQTVFGSGGAATLLTRLTTYTAVIFMITSLFLTWFSTRSLTISVADDIIPAEPPPLVAPVSEPAAPVVAQDTPATSDSAAVADEPAAVDPVTGEEPAPEKPAAAGAADLEEQKEEAAEAAADDTGAALEGAGTGTVEQVEEQTKPEDNAEAKRQAAETE